MGKKEKNRRSEVVLYINGKRHSIGPTHAGMMLADYLRCEARLPGTKIVCAEGDCGACSVLRLFCGASKAQEPYVAINSCITTVAQMDGSSLVTVEYLGQNGLDPVQAAMVACHGSQCGFCTPGFVIALKGLVEKKKLKAADGPISTKEAKNALTGNLCRCTGYHQILDAACRVDVERSKRISEASWHEKAVKDLGDTCKKPLALESEVFSVFAPLKAKDAAAYLTKYPDAKVIGAGTDLGVLVNKKKATFHRLVSLHLISSLYAIEMKRNRLIVGARVSLEDLRRSTEEAAPSLSNFLNIFASPQIKSVASLVGNLCNASPIGDTLPFLLATCATIHVEGKAKSRKISIDDFFLGYRKTALKKGELVTSIEFDIPSAGEFFSLFKSSQRKDLDISAVNGAVRIGEKVVRVALGGVAATPIRLKNVEALLQEKPLDSRLIESCVEQLQKDVKPLSDVRGSGAFRRVLAQNFLKSTLLEASARGSS